MKYYHKSFTESLLQANIKFLFLHFTLFLFILLYSFYLIVVVVLLLFLGVLQYDRAVFFGAAVSLDFVLFSASCPIKTLQHHCCV